MKSIIKECLTCEQEFEAPMKEVRRGFGKYCSITCSANRVREFKNFPNTECGYCGEMFFRMPSKKVSKSGVQFCKPVCHNLASRLEGGIAAVRPRHYGTGKAGYRKKAFREKPRICEICGYRRFPEVMHVHHVDRNRDNNTLENLRVLCPTCHAVEHFTTGTGWWAKTG